MTTLNQPFGMRPAFHPSGLDRAQTNNGDIPSGYSSNILKGQPVAYQTASGYIIPVPSTGAFCGCFAGVEWTDTTGRRRVSNYWPASTTGTDITAYFYSDPLIVYEIQADGSVAQTAVGMQANLSNLTAGSATTGLSAATMSATIQAQGVQGQLRIIDLGQGVDNAWGDAYTVVRVQIALHQFVAPATSI